MENAESHTKGAASIIALLAFLGACADSTGPGATLVSLEVERQTLDVSEGHSCALDSNGAAWCWGNNWRGELGNGTTTISTTPVQVSGGHSFVSIDVSGWTTCGLDTEGRAWCWGDHQTGQLGSGYINERYASRPRRVLLSERLVSISAGGLQTCGLAVDGAAFCWGADDYGALGNGHRDSDFGEPVEVTGGIRFRSITAGDYAVCGVALDGAAYCWGSGVGHVLGNGSESNQPSPTLVASSERWTNIYPDVLLSCGATTTAALNCWGPMSWDTARYGTYRDVATTPSPMTTSAGVREMAGMCMNMTEGPAHCMSIVVAGHLNMWVAQPIPGSIEFTRVVGNRINACGISLDRRIYCWGYNWFGQIGDGTTTHRALPTLVAGNIPWAG